MSVSISRFRKLLFALRVVNIVFYLISLMNFAGWFGHRLPGIIHPWVRKRALVVRSIIPRDNR